jgi:tetraacyldisaccharide 4'-kinase
VPVISIGNLNAGGSGKTPMTEYIIRLLSTNHKLATLSRGYKRRSKGFRIANKDDNATTIGDEPYQMFLKFGKNVVVTVGEDRAYAIPNILQEHEDIEAILLDDAFQHRAVDPSFSILLTEYNRPFTRDYVLPAGNLRESRNGASRADVIVVTKCPSQKLNTDSLTNDIRKYAGDKPVFFTTLSYRDLVAFGDLSLPSGKIILVTGIANPDPLYDHVKRHFEIIKYFRYPDHHSFTESDINDIHYEALQISDTCIVTTEKDMVRLRSMPSVSEHHWFYIPIEVEFLKNGSEFDNLVARQLKRD